MKKLVSLIKATMTDGMNLFRIRGKNQSQTSKKLLPIMLTIVMFFMIWTYANMLMEPLVGTNSEYVVLTIFVLLTTILTFVEGIYKSGNLLFNCKDDNLLLSLPIKKSTVVFIRIFKFYVFELLYNTLFLLPAMVVYIRYANVGISYYIVSFIALLLLPVIPIIISCIIGFIISASSSKFKMKNIAQIIITMIFLLLVFYMSSNIENMIGSLAQNAASINETITKIYYPAGAYINLITNFNIQELLIFIVVHILIFAVSILVLSKVYFKINSSVKAVKTGFKNSNYKIKARRPIISLIKKELGKFINTPVFVINAAFGLVLFIVLCVSICIKFDSLEEMLLSQEIQVSIEQIKSFIPVVLFGLICFASLMSSITSSMISLEGKSFSILKSLPIKPFTIILSKILAAVIIMLPFILIGDLIFFIRFNFNIFEILTILIASFILPLVAETIGILINLKYPKMDAENDTEVVKQSISSMIAVFTGMILTGITVFLLFMCIRINISANLTLLIGLAIYIIIYLGLLAYLNKNSVKEFNKINV